MKHIYFTVVTLIFLLILLSACGPSKEELAAKSAAETVAAASPTPSFTPTNTPTNTPTPTPTSTPTPTPTPTPTNTPTPTPLPQIGDTLVSKMDGMVMMYVPAGEFHMGSSEGDGDDDEHPKHLVRLDAFWMDQTEVTNAMFARFVNDMGYQTAAESAGAGLVYLNNKWTWVTDANWQHPQGPKSNIDELGNYPVVQVNWNDAVAYCTWAGRRLPTEAEWEYAAGGTDGRIFPWGNQHPSAKLLNFADVSIKLDWSDKKSNDGYEFTAPVGSYPGGASPFGILDMAGNVYELVADWYDSLYYQDTPQVNPTGPSSGDERVLRGGSFYDDAFYVRTSYRAAIAQTNQGNDVGFRCVQTP